jgi:RNA polymerase sigma-70 factor (ECF subfamily)
LTWLARLFFDPERDVPPAMRIKDEPSIGNPLHPAPSQDPDERALLASLRAAQPGAFEALVRQQTGHLLAVARRFLRNEDDAREAVQDAFLLAFRALDRFQGASRLSTWLHRILVNTCLMRLRSKGRRGPEEALDELLPTFLPNGHHETALADWSNEAHAAMERRETCELVRRSIDRLPEPYRTTLLLRDIEELSMQEVAESLGITPNAAKVRVHRARQALRTLLDPHFRGGRPR